MTDPDEPPKPDDYEVYEKYGVTWNTEDYDYEELDPPDWITDLDREICILLGRGLIFTPSLIAKNLDRPRSSVSRRLNTLEAGNIVEKVERGHYALTDEGYARMRQNIKAEHIESDPSPPDDWIVTKIYSPEEAKKLEEIDK